MGKKKLELKWNTKTKKTSLKDVAIELWDKYHSDLSTTGQVFEKKEGKWVARREEMSKENFFDIFSLMYKQARREAGNLQSYRERLKIIKKTIQNYERSLFYTGFGEQENIYTAKDLFTKNGVFNREAYRLFRESTKVKGRYTKFDYSKLKYIRQGTFIIGNQKQNYTVQRYENEDGNYVYLIYWQSPNQIEITTEEPTWLY